MKDTIYGACPFFCSISPLPILIFILALARFYMGGVVALELLFKLEFEASVADLEVEFADEPCLI